MEKYFAGGVSSSTRVRKIAQVVVFVRFWRFRWHRNPSRWHRLGFTPTMFFMLPGHFRDRNPEEFCGSGVSVHTFRARALLRNGSSDLAVGACGHVLLQLPTFPLPFRVAVASSLWRFLRVPGRSGSAILLISVTQGLLLS